MIFKNIFTGTLLTVALGGTVQIETTDTCSSQQVVVGPYQPSCPSQTSQECTYTELSQPACNKLPCSGNMKMKVHVQSVLPPGSCCRSCMCYGDPHCQSFSGVKDSWIICDARLPTKGKSWCPLSQSVCLRQLDGNGNPCVWLPPTGKKWIVAKQGSECVPNPAGPASTILMYSADSFSVSAVLGERAIITALNIKLNNKEYSISAQQCFDDNGPWIGSVPPSTVFTLSSKSTNGGSVIQNVLTDLTTGIQVNFMCIQEASEPRIAIEVFEPALPSARSNAKGFCVSNKIDKGLSYDNARTANIIKNQLCPAGNQFISNNMVIGQEICGAGVVDGASLALCMQSWCSSKVKGSISGCTQNINSQGWIPVWCSVNVLSTQNSTNCAGNDKCQMCLNDMQDFGFVTASATWSGYGAASQQCLSSLPTSLGTCDNGLNLQYLDPVTSNWITYRSIPQGQSVCDGHYFSSDVDTVLFTNRVRIASCPSTCASSQCSFIQGYKVKIDYIKAPDMCPCKPQPEYESSKKGRRLEYENKY